jgi:hypothetical protein
MQPFKSARELDVAKLKPATIFGGRVTRGWEGGERKIFPEWPFSIFSNRHRFFNFPVYEAF